MGTPELTVQSFRELSPEEQLAFNGGGFAYDAGRVLRFIIIAGPRGQFTPMAVTDWMLNTAR
jgi:hypothetical protein